MAHQARDGPLKLAGHLRFPVCQSWSCVSVLLFVAALAMRASMVPNAAGTRPGHPFHLPSPIDSFLPAAQGKSAPEARLRPLPRESRIEEAAIASDSILAKGLASGRSEHHRWTGLFFLSSGSRDAQTTVPGTYCPTRTRRYSCPSPRLSDPRVRDRLTRPPAKKARARSRTVRFAQDICNRTGGAGWPACHAACWASDICSASRRAHPHHARHRPVARMHVVRTQARDWATRPPRLRNQPHVPASVVESRRHGHRRCSQLSAVI